MSFRVFEEDFQRYDAGSSGQPVWTPVAGRWVIELEGARKVYAQRDTTTGIPQISLSNAKVKNGAVEAVLRVEEGYWAGLVFRAADEKNMYQFYANYQAIPNMLAVMLAKYVNGGWTSIKSAEVGVGKQGDIIEIRVELSGAQIKVYANKVFLFEVTDNTFLGSGYVGLVTWHGTNAKFYSVIAEMSAVPIIVGAGGGAVVGGVAGYLLKEPLGPIMSEAVGAVLGGALGGGIGLLTELEIIPVPQIPSLGEAPEGPGAPARLGKYQITG